MKAREKKNKWWERKGDAMGMAEKHGREDRDNACNNLSLNKPDGLISVRSWMLAGFFLTLLGPQDTGA